MKKTEIYGLHYWNGEKYEDSWSGIDITAGLFTTIELAEVKKRELEIASAFRIKEEIEMGYINPPFENEKWEVVKLDLFGDIN